MIIPEAFLQYPQFINHNSSKIPIDVVTNKAIDPHNPSNQMTAQSAMLASSNVSFVFTETDPFFFVDIDHCLQADGTWSPMALEVLTVFAGCAVEVSMSGTGLHIFGTYSTRPSHSCKNIANGIELYTMGRFCALTGTSAQGDASIPCDQQLSWLIDKYFTTGATLTAGEWTTTPCEEWNGIPDDIKLIDAMIKSKPSASAVFGTSVSFSDLWYRNVEALSAAFPHPTQEFDHSSADASLIQRLAFWTGRDCGRMELLFSLSSLVRDKWIDRKDYRERTILQACLKCDKVHRQDVEAVLPTNHANVTKREGYQYLSFDSQIEYFKDCVYVSHDDKILIPNGRMLKQTQFNTLYGGYSFAMDAIGDKTTTEAWKVFTQSQALDFPKADHTCFVPPQPYATLVTDDIGHVGVNTYLPAIIDSKQGDVTPFLTHLAKMLPNTNDRAIIIAYMAACIQHIGVKFQWAPLVQGVQGNGKSLLTRCLKKAIGERYCHTPNPKNIDNQFNQWIEGKLLIVIEEINVAGKWELMDVLKPMITQQTLEIQSKGIDQRTGHICANFFMNSNYKDGLVKTVGDRRHCILWTAQQDIKDLVKHGMTGQYFPDIYKWLRAGGYANVTHYLQHYKIPDALNPAVDCQRAPTTSSTLDAIAFSLGTAEHLIIEAIAEARVGFMGGWISSMAVSKLLKSNNIHKSYRHRKQMMEDIGYIYHPGLKEGRCTMKTMIDGGKPRLYCRPNSLQSSLKGPILIAEVYTKAQGIDTPVTTATSLQFQ